MEHGKLNTDRNTFNWLKPLVIVVLAIGIFFRFTNLDKKVYWHDENLSSFYTSGYIGVEIRDRIADGGIISIEDLHKYHQVNDEKSLSDIVKTFAKHNPQHPPTYYILLRIWMQRFGDSIASARSFSAVTSLLAFPLIYWLCWELFQSPAPGWIGMMLVATSPFHLLYAQEARQYSLWTVAILLSSATVIRAVRLQTLKSWFLYAIAAAISLYAHLFSILLLAGHSLYGTLQFGFKQKKALFAYLGSLIAGFILFLPWIAVILSNLVRVEKSTSWSRQGTTDFAFLFKWWGRNLSTVFIDLDPNYNFFHALRKSDWLFVPLILILVGYSIYFLCRKTDRSVWSFVLIILATTCLPLVFPDVLFGGWRSLVSRYFIPAYLAIEVAVAYLLSSQLLSFSAPRWRQRFWQLIAIILVTGGLVSCYRISQANAWWNKHVNYYYPNGAEIVNRSEHPLVVSDTKLIGNIFSLSYLLKPNTQLQLWTPESLERKNILNTQPFRSSEQNSPTKAFDRIFLFNPSKKLIAKLAEEGGFQVDSVYKAYNLEIFELE